MPKNDQIIEPLRGAFDEVATAMVSEKKKPIPKKTELSDFPQATHEGVLEVGGSEITCYVLENGERILSTRGIMQGLGRTWRGRKYSGTDLPVFIEANNLKPYIPDDLELVPKKILTPRGVAAEGFKADTLPAVCDVYLSARSDGALTAAQQKVALQCEILVRAFARVGIIALVDEATGYQYDRPRRELEDQLKKFLSDSLRRWAKTFPADYFKHLCRLRGVDFRPDMKLPQYFGHLTNNLVYRRIAPGLLRRLKELKAEKGSANNKQFQWLSTDVGVPELLLHLGTVTAVMKQHKNYDEFERALDQIAPIYAEFPGLFDDPKDWELPE